MVPGSQRQATNVGKANSDKIPINEGSAILAVDDIENIWYPGVVKEVSRDGDECRYTVSFDDAERNGGNGPKADIRPSGIRFLGIKIADQNSSQIQKPSEFELDVSKRVMVYVSQKDSWVHGRIFHIRCDDTYDVILPNGEVLVSVPAKLLRLKVEYDIHEESSHIPASISRRWLDGTYDIILDACSELVKYVNEASLRLPKVHIEIPYEIVDTLDAVGEGVRGLDGENAPGPTKVHCKHGHRMALSDFNKGGYRYEEEDKVCALYSCDDCGELKTGPRHFCILCTSDLCLQCPVWDYEESPYEATAPDCPIVWQTQKGNNVIYLLGFENMMHFLLFCLCAYV